MPVLFSRLLLPWMAFAIVNVKAIVTSGDNNDPKFLADLASDAPFFVSLREKGDCAGTIVSNHHVVTAAHCIESDSPKTIFSDGSSLEPWAAFMNPNCIYSVEDDGPNGCDVSVLAFSEDLVEKLGGDITIALPVYPFSDEVGKTMTIYGYGLTGDAADFANGCRKAEEDGKFRRARNVVTDVSDGVVRYRMDDDDGLNLEGMAQDGDSGGTATITVNGSTYLVGANSGTMEGNSCDYGSIDEYVRLSEHFDFIEKILDYPNDQSICPWKIWKEPTTGPYNETCTPPSSATILVASIPKCTLLLLAIIVCHLTF